MKFQGHDCVTLENGTIRLLVTQSVGPRILSFGFQNGENLFAELPDVAADCPGSGTFHFYGGHRLWHAPEEPARTYLPDDTPVEISPYEGGLLVTQPVEAKTGLQKSMEIRLVGEQQVVVRHSIRNQNLWEVTCAPWAITQLKTGGTGLFPQILQDTGVLPNRTLTLWPYTGMSSPNVHWGSDLIMLQARMDSPFKIGFPNPRGWLAYWWNGMLFVKQADFDPNAGYFDFGSSSQCYCNQQFIELETLAPITRIPPEGSATHVELWSLYGDIERPADEHEGRLLAAKLGLS